MSELKSIQVEGKMTLIFDENVSLTVEETKETTLEVDDMPIGMFKQFLQLLFTEGKMSLEEQTKVMQMTVSDFCALYDTVTPAYQENDNPIPPGVPRMQFLANLGSYACPRCHAKNTFKLVDGNLHCATCLHDFGDVDDLREILSV